MRESARGASDLIEAPRSLAERVRREQIRALYEELPFSALGMTIGGLIVVAGLWQSSSPRALPFARGTTNAEALTRLRNLLTPQELRVLGLLLKGYSNKEIARAIGKETHSQRSSSIAESTVKAHMTNILRALGVERRTQAALAVERLGVHPDDLLGGEDKA